MTGHLQFSGPPGGKYGLGDGSKLCYNPSFRHWRGTGPSLQGNPREGNGALVHIRCPSLDLPTVSRRAGSCTEPPSNHEESSRKGGGWVDRHTMDNISGDSYLRFLQVGEINEVLWYLSWPMREIWDIGKWEEATVGRSIQTEAGKLGVHKGKHADEI